MESNVSINETQKGAALKVRRAFEIEEHVRNLDCSEEIKPSLEEVNIACDYPCTTIAAVEVF